MRTRQIYFNSKISNTVNNLRTIIRDNFHIPIKNKLTTIKNDLNSINSSSNTKISLAESLKTNTILDKYNREGVTNIDNSVI